MERNYQVVGVSSVICLTLGEIKLLFKERNNKYKGSKEKLKSAPSFDGLLGPMEGGGEIIRYETPLAYKSISI